MTDPQDQRQDHDPPPRVNAAEQLEGLTLKGGWKVIEKARAAQRPTGGCFSVGYIVESENGIRAFLKAFDFFSWIEDHEDPLRELEPLIAAFNYERDLLKLCGDRRMSRVVRALDDGTVLVPGFAGPLGSVQYLIFELAEGDIRRQLDTAHEFDTAWAHRALHHVAVALEQLHRADVVHQDLKPSNVLMFEKRTSAKIGDLGRAAGRGKEAPLVSASVAGDARYSPPENLYGRSSSEWKDRLARDAYHLGSMIVFFFTHASMTGLLAAYLQPSHHWTKWTGTFEEVLPYVRAAFDEALGGIEVQLPEQFRQELLSLIRELCEPDPALRGSPMNRRRGTAACSLERYVSRLDVVAKRAEYLAGVL